MATHLLVGNPTAQSGKNAERIDRARSLLAAYGVSTDLLKTLPHGQTIVDVRKALDHGGYTHVISMGGDGTFREVASGLLMSTRREVVALAMLPTGTANDQGKSFGLASSADALETNVRVIAEGHEVLLDAGTIEAWEEEETVVSRYFFDSAGWGISARVLSARNEDRRLVEEVPGLGEVYRDELVYAGAALRVFLESYIVPDKFDVEVGLDGKRRILRGVSDLIVKNTRIYAGAWVFDQASRPDDGLFEIVPFHGKRDWTSKAILGLDGNPLTEELLNAVGIEHSKTLRAANITLTFKVPPGSAALAAQIDGEEFPASSLVKIHVSPRAIRLVVPRPPG